MPCGCCSGPRRGTRPQLRASPKPEPRGSIDPLHFAQNPALVHWEHRLIVPDLLKDCSTGELVTCFFEVIPEKENRKSLLKLHLLEREPRCALATAGVLVNSSQRLIKGQMGLSGQRESTHTGRKAGLLRAAACTASPPSASEAAAFSSHPPPPEAHAV